MVVDTSIHLALRVNLNLSLANPSRTNTSVDHYFFAASLNSTIATTMTVLSTLRGGAGGAGGRESDDDLDEETDAVMKERVKPS